jgi:hypothetical protein
MMLDGKVHALNLAMHDVANDGNCFYRALAVVMTDTQDTYLSIRQLIADYSFPLLLRLSFLST